MPSVTKLWQMPHLKGDLRPVRSSKLHQHSFLSPSIWCPLRASTDGVNVGASPFPLKPQTGRGTPLADGATAMT